MIREIENVEKKADMCVRNFI